MLSLITGLSGRSRLSRRYISDPAADFVSETEEERVLLIELDIEEGGTGDYQYKSASRIPPFSRTCIQLQNMLREYRHYREALCGTFTFLIMMMLHWIHGKDSNYLTLYLFTCDGSSRIQRCSLFYGCIESIIFAAALMVSYYVFFALYFRIRYHYKSTDVISGLDAYFIAMPWLMSPILRWHAITSLLIDSARFCDGLFFYEYPDDIASRNLLDGTLTTSHPASITSIYELASYPILLAAVIRTLWSFFMWTGVDAFLWSNTSLLWLFENGPNSAISSLRLVHRRSVHHILLSRFEGVGDVTALCIDYLGDEPPPIVLDLKRNILESLRAKDLSTAYKVFSVTVAVVSALRFWLCPSVGYMLSPVFKGIGVWMIEPDKFPLSLIIIQAIIAILTGKDTSGSTLGDLLEIIKSSQKHRFSVFFGAFFAAVLWGCLVWLCMWRRLQTLKHFQANSTS